MADYEIKLETGYINITPSAFLFYAQDFLSAGQQWTSTKSYSPVPYFLFCRAIELGLKSFLLAKGKSVKDVKDQIRHNLESALQAAGEEQLDTCLLTSIPETIEINKASELYKDKGFEYFNIESAVKGKSDLPNLEVLKDYAEKLLKGIEEFVRSTT